MLEDDAGEFMNLCLGEEPPNMWSRLQLAVAFRRMLKGCSEQYSGTYSVHVFVKSKSLLRVKEISTSEH